tara:strand:+ start:33 stop:413 length:381 start_codon:yes stop_codon:yes gene_type:complete
MTRIDELRQRIAILPKGEKDYNITDFTKASEDVGSEGVSGEELMRREDEGLCLECGHELDWKITKKTKTQPEKTTFECPNCPKLQAAWEKKLGQQTRNIKANRGLTKEQSKRSDKLRKRIARIYES